MGAHFLLSFGDIHDALYDIHDALYTQRYGRGRSAGWRDGCRLASIVSAEEAAADMPATRIATGALLNEAAARRRGA